MTISIHTQIREVEREITMRKQVYFNQVRKGKMRQSEADLLISNMEAVRKTLEFCRDNEPEIRSFIAQRSEAVSNG